MSRTATEQRHRAMIAPLIDRLVSIDNDSRTAAVRRMREVADLIVLKLVREGLVNRATYTPNAATCRAALSALIQLGGMGGILLLNLALRTRAEQVREIAMEVLCQESRELPPAEWMELQFCLQVTKGQAKSPAVVGACEIILAAMEPEGSVFVDHAQQEYR